MNRKRRLLLFCFVVLAATLALASSLHDVHFQPGRSLSTPASVDTPLLVQVPETLSSTPLWKILLFWLAFVINLFLFFYLLPPELRRKILRQVLSFSIGTLILLIALRYRLIDLPTLNGKPVDAKGAPPSGLETASTPAPFQPPQVTPWMTYLISFGVLLVLLFLLWFAYRWWIRTNARRNSSLHILGGIAQASLDDLASGHDWGDVITRSYMQMTAVVNTERGLQRPASATPREFAKRLEKDGLPAEAVNQLTRLFESVRYGARKSNQSDINEAVACLNSIVQACGITQ
jgi:hypothetical protein